MYWHFILLTYHADHRVIRHGTRNTLHDYSTVKYNLLYAVLALTDPSKLRREGGLCQSHSN
jgi:hypothetical protein